MITIPLSKDKSALVDKDDYTLIEDINWLLFEKKYLNKTYYYAYYSIFDEQKKRKRVFLHHLIFGRPPKGMTTMFKDGNSLNCQKTNLQFITFGQKSHKFNYVKKDTLQRGVYYKYIAKININGKNKLIGFFDTAEEAALAYNQKAIEIYGEHAVLNIIK